MSNPNSVSLADSHSWLSFTAPDEDGDDRTFLVDLTFFESNYTCIFGAGCQGIEEEPQPEAGHGCCVHGAHFVDKDDLKNVKKYVAELTSEHWQFKDVGDKKGWWKVEKDDDTGEDVVMTRKYQGACIFNNRPEFAGGPGCALHIKAVAEGVNPLEYKPEVCWQVPIRREDEVQPDGSIVTKIGQWDRAHWSEGGHDFHWWCLEAPEAFVGKEPVYRGFHGELTRMMGEVAYSQLVDYLDSRRDAGVVSLPHPTLRKR